MSYKLPGRRTLPVATVVIRLSDTLDEIKSGLHLDKVTEEADTQALYQFLVDFKHTVCKFGFRNDQISVMEFYNLLHGQLTSVYRSYTEDCVIRNVALPLCSHLFENYEPWFLAELKQFLGARLSAVPTRNRVM